MGDKKNENTFFGKIIFGVMFVSLVWAGSATLICNNYRNKYNDLRSTIENADGSGFMETIRQQRGIIYELQNDLGAIRSDLKSALSDVESLRGVIGRASSIAVGSEKRFIEFEKSMASYGTGIDAAIQRQFRIESLIRELKTDNLLIRNAFRMRD